MERAKSNSTLIQTRFFDYNVHSLGNNHTFLHIYISDGDALYEQLAEFFLDETRLIRYVENDRAVCFSATKAQIAELYKRLSLFAADYREITFPPETEQSLIEDMRLDFDIDYLDERGYVAKQPAIGRLGEYFLHVILSEFFGLNCIIPKISLTTDRNMSVFGIDSLFYSAEKRTIYFGESKFSKALTNGITLLRRSLKTYEKQIEEEFELVLSDRHLVRHPEFERVFGNGIASTISFSDFATRAKLETICVPLFVAHGGEKDPDSILEKLAGIPTETLFGLQTQYWGLSLPVVSKEKLVRVMVEQIDKRRNALYVKGKNGC